MCSYWPLSPAELVAAVCQDPDTDEIDEVDININTVYGACQHLFIVDPELNVCRFSHLSIREYFEILWGTCRADCLVGKVCLSFLISNSTTPKQSEHLKENGKDKRPGEILKYACLNWSTHVKRLERRGSVENRLTALLKNFLGSMDQSSFAYQKWHEMLGNYFERSRWPQSYPLPVCQVYERLSLCSQASFAIMTFGFYQTTLNWWMVGFVNINPKNSFGESLLHLAAMEGLATVAENFLKKEANVNVSGGEFGSAMEVASSQGHETVIQLLQAAIDR